MNFFNIGRGRRFAGADSPNRFIGNNGVGSGCIVGNGTGNLFGANIQSFAGIAFGLGFTDTDNRFQTVFMSGARFLLNNFVDFTMLGAALGVTENNIRAADFLNLGRADVSGVGAFVFPMAVLSTEGNLGTAQRLFNRSRRRCRRTDQKFTFGFADLKKNCGNFLSQFNTVSQKTVHFPVSGNKFFTSHVFILLSQLMPRIDNCRRHHNGLFVFLFCNTANLFFPV